MTIAGNSIFKQREKFRRLAARAQLNNPAINPQLIGSIAWAASTAVTQGAVRSNGGKVYVCAAGGTTAASGGPTGRGTGITDSGATWDYIGPQTAPVLTVNASGSTPAGLNSTPIAYPSAALRFGGGRVVTTSSSAAQIAATTSGPGAVGGLTGDDGNKYVGNGCFWEICTDAPKVAFQIFRGGSPVNFIITDEYTGVRQYIDFGWFLPQDYGSGSRCWPTLDFTNAGGRRPRTIRMELGNVQPFYGVHVASLFDQVWAPSTADRMRIAWLGDSWVAAGVVSPVQAQIHFPPLVTWMVGGDDSINSGGSGTGYIQTTTAVTLAMPDRAADVGSVSADIVCVGPAGINDPITDYSAIQAAVLRGLQNIRALSSAPIIQWGFNTYGNNGATASFEAAIAAAVASFNDPRTAYIPVSGDALGSWITGTGNTGAPAGNGNADNYVTSSHLNNAGNLYFANRMAQKMRGVIETGI